MQDPRSVKGERTECKNYGSITLLSVVGKLYVGGIVNRLYTVTDKQEGFRVRRSCVDLI